VSARIGLFEQANGGTIFLDEIGDTSPAFQVKLLRVLQEREVRPIGANRRRQVDVRVVAATNRDLEREIREGRFRADLYYRLAGVRMHLPTLRERPMDIPVIALGILDEARRTFAKPVDGFTDEALACLRAYHWPGNVRELQNEVQRLVVLADGPRIGADLLDGRILRATPSASGMTEDGSAGHSADWDEKPSGGLTRFGPLKDRVEALEARVLRETLIRLRWNKTQAADELGLSRVGLRSKMERYGLVPAGVEQEPDGLAQAGTRSQT
jgi:two-component system response regulator HupR/HoxA